MRAPDATDECVRGEFVVGTAVVAGRHFASANDGVAALGVGLDFVNGANVPGLGDLRADTLGDLHEVALASDGKVERRVAQ